MSAPVLAPELLAVHAGRLEALRRRPLLLGLGGLAALAVAIVAGIALLVWALVASSECRFNY